MRAARQWGQILLGVGLGLLIGGISNLVRSNLARQTSTAAFILLLLAILCIGAGLSLMRRGGPR